MTTFIYTSAERACVCVCVCVARVLFLSFLNRTDSMEKIIKSFHPLRIEKASNNINRKKIRVTKSGTCDEQKRPIGSKSCRTSAGKKVITGREQ